MYPSNVIHKPALYEFIENGGYFEDGSYEKFDEVIYCTGKSINIAHSYCNIE